jgi:hypothetical protein
MGFRARKSFKVMPGVRMTVTPRGVSTSVGGRGGRVSVHSSGRVTRSVGIPGTGVSYTSSGRGSRPAAKAPARKAAPPPPPKPVQPGLFAPKWEKALFKAMTDQDAAQIRRVATEHETARQPAALLEGLYALSAGDAGTVRDLFAWLWSTPFDPEQDAFISKYLPHAAVTLEVASGITAQLPVTRDAIGLVLAEAHQSVGELAAATEVVEQVTPSTIAAVSLAELYGEQERWDDVIDLTNGLTNEDDASVFLLTQRATAFRESGSPGAARESLKEALRIRSRPAELRHRALIERAYTYLAENKRAMARKDLEKVQAENAAYPGLAQALAELPTA